MYLKWEKIEKRFRESGLDITQERFCRLVAEGSTAKDAYATCYGVDNSYACNKLSVDPRVKVRISEIREAVMKDTEFNVTEVLSAFFDVYKESRTYKDRPSALRALENIAKHLGMFVARTETTMTLTGMSNAPEDLPGQLEKLAKAAGVTLIMEDESAEKV